MKTTVKEKYKLTNEHQAQLKPWADRWIANAMSTQPMSADDKLDCVTHVNNLYKAANLNPPEHVLFVSSPMALVLVGGLVSAIYEMGDKSPMTVLELVKLVNSGELLTKGNDEKWYSNPYKMKSLSKKLGFGTLGIDCIRQVHNMWNGGNQWSGWVSYLSFFRHVAKLDIDYSKWDCYEKLTELSGPRVLHEKFCVISDRPEILTVNSQNQPHGVKKPFCKWRDGSALYSVNGVRVPAYIVETPEKLTVEKIEKESNLEVRRVMIDIYGQEKFLLDSKSEVIHSDDFGTLYSKVLPGDEVLMMVKVVNSTPEPDGSFKDYFIRVDPKAYGGLKTARAAVASTWRNPDRTMVFENPNDYTCAIES